MTRADNNRLWIVVVVAILAVAVFGLLTMPDRRTPTEKLGDAVSELDEGPEKAARQLGDRTPGERLGDAVEDAGERAGENIRRSTDNQ